VDALPDPADFVRSVVAVKDREGDNRQPFGLRTPRSDEYHAWRFQRHPTARYVQIEGRAGTAIARLAFRGKRRELLISDLYGESLPQTIRRCRHVAKTSYVGAFFSKGSPERAAAYRAGMVPVPGAGLTLMVRPLRPLDVEVNNFREWDLSLSDLELL
jgi:hypothetical protein